MSLMLSPNELSESDDERSQELGAIASIFPEELTILSPYSGVIVLAVSPLEPLVVSFPSIDVPTRLEHLPPIRLKFELPETYPADAPPNIELSTALPWLPTQKLSALKEECLELWEEYGRGQVLFALIDNIQQSAERAFGIDKPLQVREELRERMLAFDEETKYRIFNQGTYDCGICLEPKKGSICHAMRPCTHVFCRACLQDYYAGLIKEGDVSSVRCSDPLCVKNAIRQQVISLTPPGEGNDAQPKIVAPSLPPTLSPEELTQIGIPADLVTRYVVLKKKKALEKDPKTVYCPRQWCQAPSRASVQSIEESMKTSGSGYWLPDRGALPPSLEEEKDEEKGKEKEKPSLLKEKLQVCSVCSFAFCQICLASWHGDYQICKPVDGTLTEEEIANENFLRENTTPCPTCQSPVLKSHGCNHMICACATHFCFLCSAYLPAENPYTHFNLIGTECYQRLWEGEEGDIENQRLIRHPHPPVEEVPPEPQPEQPEQQPEPFGLRLPLPPLDENVENGMLMWVDGVPFQIVFEDSDVESDEELVDFGDIPDDPAPVPAARGRGRQRGHGAGGDRGRGRGLGRGAVDGDRGRGGGGRGRARRPRPAVHRREHPMHE